MSPIARAFALAALTLVGVVGLLVSDGYGEVAMLAIAALPLLIGAICYVRASIQSGR